MNTNPANGTILRTDPAHCTLSFERHFDAPIERVWAALTDPALLGGWLADSSIDLRVGGTIVHEFDPDDVGSRVDGTILVLDPPRTLEYEWRFLGETDSVLRYDLVADADGTRLTLTHRMLGTDQAAGYGAGWHTYLDALGALLAGSDAGDWGSGYAAELPYYMAALNA
jgi:uncharacterized protein YndB with AHSA1/START domain